MVQPDYPLRRAAEAWARGKVDSKGWRLIAWEPNQVTYIGEAVSALPSGDRVLELRSEFYQAVTTKEGPINGQKVAIQLDCAKKAYRPVAVWAYGKTNLADPTAYVQNTIGPWSSFESDARFGPEYSGVCASPPASATAQAPSS